MKKLSTILSILLILSIIFSFETTVSAEERTTPSINEKDDNSIVEMEDASEENGIEQEEDEDSQPVESSDSDDKMAPEDKLDEKSAEEGEQINDSGTDEEKAELEKKESQDFEDENEMPEDSEKQRIQSFSLMPVEEKTSRLGHIRRSNVEIFEDLSLASSFQAGSTYTNKVYYIKSQAEVNKQRYYLISTAPSSERGTVGWVKSEDLSTHTHNGLDRKSKAFYIKGTGKAYEHAWGGSKDLVYNLSELKGELFQVHLTEKVGENTWYRGNLSGQTVWVHEAYLDATSVSQVSRTSRLGHIRRSNVEIFEDLSLASSFQAGSTYTNKVYYIKSQAEVNKQRYYLISTAPSSKRGTVGWVKSEDLSTHLHKGVDRNSKTFYIKGTGKAYEHAWGGSNDLVYNLSELKGELFQVHLTEKVGNNTWYRGNLQGKTVWIHEAYLDGLQESTTSRLGHIRRANVNIYDDLSFKSSFQAETTYTHKVYYIKKQADIGSQRYYLISTAPSSERGTVGWVKAEDLSTHPHTGIDRNSKTLYIKGTGNAYLHAWGGSQDLIYNLSEFKGDPFQIHLTEKVGNNTWYRGNFRGKTVWIHEAYLAKANHTPYNLTLEQALDIQMKASPQTDQRYAYVSSAYIDNNQLVTASKLNVRSGAGTSAKIVGTLSKGDKVNIISEYNGWLVIDFVGSEMWVDARPEDVLYYLNPQNFLNDEKQKFQFLDLSRSSGASQTVLNNYLKGKGILEGRAQAFIDGGRQNGINDVYLISHAVLETGHGTSKLANGIEVGKNNSGSPVLVTKNNRNNLTEIKTVYNMYGIGAYDSCAVECGAIRAYENGWTTPDMAIIGGAKFIDEYINRGQNTLYKMRWDPAAMERTGAYGRQYATDIGWASKQIHSMYNLYQSIGSYTLNLDVPFYK